MKRIIFWVTFSGVFFLATVAVATAWPATDEALFADSDTLGAGYEPSGIVGLSDGRLVLVGDDGDVTLFSSAGVVSGSWTPGGDLEGVTETGDGYVYVAVENPDTIKQFDLDSGAYTGLSWDVTAWLTGADNSGMEALTFVPNAYHSYAASDAGGLFYAGLQADGQVYVIDVDLTTSDTAELVDTLDLGQSSDISGLDFDAGTGLVYALFDSANVLLEVTPAGVVQLTYDAPGNDQEGVAVVPACDSDTATVYIAEDVGPEVWTYSPYPVSCTEEDEPLPDDETPPEEDPGSDDPVDDTPDAEDPVDEDPNAEDPADNTPGGDDEVDDDSDNAPATPTQVRKSRQAVRKFMVRWQGSGDTYRVKLYTKQKQKTVKTFRGITAKKKVIGKRYVTGDRAYWVRVRACNQAGCSGWSDFVRLRRHQ